MPELEIALTVNGRAVRWHLEPGETLLEALHAHHLKGTKLICGTGDCCGCGVMLNGNSINACCMLAAQAEDGDLLTVEGLAQNGKLHPIQEAFAQEGAAQCGYCTPGILLTAKALLDDTPRPSRQEIKEALAGNLCRCTGYIKILEAVELAAARIAGEQAEPAKETVYGWE